MIDRNKLIGKFLSMGEIMVREGRSLSNVIAMTQFPDIHISEEYTLPPEVEIAVVEAFLLECLGDEKAERRANADAPLAADGEHVWAGERLYNIVTGKEVVVSMIKIGSTTFVDSSGVAHASGCFSHECPDMAVA